MRWRLILKGRTPTSGRTFKDWKAPLSDEAKHRCVFCCIHEESFGGSRNFHVEHYRPKHLFGHLIDDYRNLFYSCAICNSFKGVSWPAEPLPDHSIPAFPDPSVYDYSTLLEVDSDKIVQGIYPASKYLVDRLYLNRPQLVMERREVEIKEQLKALSANLKSLKESLSFKRLNLRQQNSILNLMSDSLLRITALQNERSQIRPYQPSDIRRP